MSQIQEKLVSLSNKAKNVFFKKRFDQIIFLDKDFSKSIKVSNSTKLKAFNHKSCVILSPSLYWIRKRELPSINSVYSARKISGAVFDDLEEKNLIIRVLKGEGSSYFFIAIDKENIASQMQKHLKIDSRDSYFCTSQEFFQNFSKPVELNESNSLVNIDGVTERVPSVYLSETPKKSIQDIAKVKAGSFFSTFKIDDSSKKHIAFAMDTSGMPIKLLAASLVLLSLSWLAESIIHYKNGSKVTQKITELKESYKLPSTNLEIDNVITKAKNIESTQNSIRETTKAINSLSLPKEETLESIKIAPNSIVFAIKTSRGEAIKSELSKTIKISSVEKNGDLTLFKVAIK